MTRRFCAAAAVAFAAVIWTRPLLAASYYPLRPDDPRAVYFTGEAFGARADGAGDDADALQQAINRVQETTRAGVVFIPEGRYRLGKTVYRLNAGQGGPVEMVPESPEPAPQTVLLLPVGLHNPLWMLQDVLTHRGYVYRPGSNTAVVSAVADEHRGYFYAPGTHTAIMAGGSWRPYLQSSQFAGFAPGDRHYLTSEEDGRTYVATLGPTGVLTTRVFAERGGTSVVADAAGHVYIASGQVWIYDRNGKPIGVLEVPERPGSLAFGGPDKQTLFIGARSALYSIRTKAPG